jgi:hypothetical protein
MTTVQNADFKAVQVSKAAAKAKFSRLTSTTGQNYGTIGFANWFLMQEDGDWYIVATSTYHALSTLERMYKTNGKNW